MALEIAGNSSKSPSIGRRIAPGATVLLLSFTESTRPIPSAQSMWCLRDSRDRHRALEGENSMKFKFNDRAPEVEARSSSPFTNASIWSSEGLLEAIWDTLFTLATATAIYLGVASLASHLNDAQSARNAAIETGKQVGMISSGRLSSSVNQTGGQRTSKFN
jgi:hypothetical protein